MPYTKKYHASKNATRPSYRGAYKPRNKPNASDDNDLSRALKVIPVNGIFNITDISVNTLYSPSKTNLIIKALEQKGYVKRINTNLKNDIETTYKITESGLNCKKTIDINFNDFGVAYS